MGRWIRKHVWDIAALLMIAGLWALLVIARQVFIYMIPFIVGR